MIPQKGLTVRSSLFLWQLLFEKSVVIAVPVEHAHAPQLKPCLGLSFRIELHHLDPVTGDEGCKGNIVLLGHRMGNGDKMLILHIFDGDSVITIRLFCLQGRQGDPAAADDGMAYAVDHITTDGANIEFGAQHIGRDILIDDMLPIHQFNHGDIQCLGQGLKQGNIRQPLGSFPLGDGFAADPDFLGQFLLGQIPCFPKLTDGCACNVGVHRNTSFHPKSTMSS